LSLACKLIFCSESSVDLDVKFIAAVAMPFPSHGSEFDRAWRGLPLLYSNNHNNSRKYPLCYVNSHHHQYTYLLPLSEAFSSYTSGVLNIMDIISVELLRDKIVATNIYFHLRQFTFMVRELLNLMKTTSEKNHQDKTLRDFMDHQRNRLYSMKSEVHIGILCLGTTKSAGECIFKDSSFDFYILEECSCKHCKYYWHVMDMINKFTRETKLIWNFAKTRLSFTHQSELVEWHCFVPPAAKNPSSEVTSVISFTADVPDHSAAKTPSSDITSVISYTAKQRKKNKRKRKKKKGEENKEMKIKKLGGMKVKKKKVAIIMKKPKEVKQYQKAPSATNKMHVGERFMFSIAKSEGPQSGDHPPAPASSHLGAESSSVNQRVQQNQWRVLSPRLSWQIAWKPIN